MRFLIMGGTNFIGPPTVDRLVEMGNDVTVFHRGEHEVESIGDVRHVHGDRRELMTFRPEFERVAPDVVIDMAAMTEADASATIGALRGITRRAVCVSSIDVYRAFGRMHGSEPGPIEPMPLTEESPLREKRYPYRGERAAGALDDYDKVLVEQAFMSADGMAGSVARLPAVHGERDYQRRLFMEVVRMDAKRRSIIVPEAAMRWRWPRGYVGNVADAIALVATDERAAGRVYHVAEPETLTQEEWTRAVGDVVGWRGEIAAMANELLPAHLRVPQNCAQDMVVDSTRIRHELGYGERVSLRDGIARAVDWERAHPPSTISAKLVDFAAEDAAIARWRATTGASPA
jgi:nucleoside-diphosphate-sugar epimerase